jgi:cytochrome c
MRWAKTVAVALSFGVWAGCGGAAEETHAGGATSPAGAKGDQVATGQSLYGDNCASCHGASGEGKGKAPPVVGKSALPLDPRPGSKRTAQFKTVADVAVFVKASMPPAAPGSLTEEQYWAILAFDLKANGIDLGGKTLDGPLASTLVIPR